MEAINTILNFLCENWLFIVTAVIIVILAVVSIKRFMALAADKQKAKVKEWLLYAVTSAEAELGAGTGKLKLATVYDKFVASFPVLKNFITVEKFSAWVDEALEDMRHLLETNSRINAIVTGENTGGGANNPIGFTI